MSSGGATDRRHAVIRDLELICFESTTIHILNGQVVCVTTNARKSNEQRVERGTIALVGYHGTILVREVELRMIEAPPQDACNLAATSK